MIGFVIDMCILQIEKDVKSFYDIAADDTQVLTPKGSFEETDGHICKAILTNGEIGEDGLFCLEDIAIGIL